MVCAVVLALALAPDVEASLQAERVLSVGIAGLGTGPNPTIKQAAVRMPTSSRPFPHAANTAPRSTSLASSEASPILRPSATEAYEIICAYTDWNCGLMLAVASRESGFDPMARNLNCWPDYPYMYVCWGWFQHRLSAGVDGSWLYDPVVNTALAHDKWLSGGMYHWRATQ